ncbi:hypothetical protein N7510_000436 [Penicillium lagena]|uniref:uncharacterized protein n=1 Tax=Penicillium lagena TaxID=94218 RepID=UPI00254001BB|nr:uncharacterized protein N7510_000436 [Penicillium lagena]KAJ5624127.1 hypothetical protein N7510_000436 [Penicillium lagena]
MYLQLRHTLNTDNRKSQTSNPKTDKEPGAGPTATQQRLDRISEKLCAEWIRLPILQEFSTPGRLVWDPG